MDGRIEFSNNDGIYSFGAFAIPLHQRMASPRKGRRIGLRYRFRIGRDVPPASAYDGDPLGDPDKRLIEGLLDVGSPGAGGDVDPGIGLYGYDCLDALALPLEHDGRIYQAANIFRQSLKTLVNVVLRVVPRSIR